MLQYGEQRHALPPVGVGTLAARVVIADVQPLVLEGLAQILRVIEPASVERCNSGQELLAMVVSVQPDLVIMDSGLSEPNGLGVLRELKERGVQVPVILMAGALGDNEVLEAVQLGIRGLLLKA